MKRITLDFSGIALRYELHLALKKAFGFPEYYGMNLDALHDCLSERKEPLNLWIASEPSGEIARSLAAVCAVVEDLGGTIREI